jgi:hypothetical protein
VGADVAGATSDEDGFHRGCGCERGRRIWREEVRECGDKGAEECEIWARGSEHAQRRVSTRKINPRATECRSDCGCGGETNGGTCPVSDLGWWLVSDNGSNTGWLDSTRSPSHRIKDFAAIG